jgi:hypothetical protein
MQQPMGMGLGSKAVKFGMMNSLPLLQTQDQQKKEEEEKGRRSYLEGAGEGNC